MLPARQFPLLALLCLPLLAKAQPILFVDADRLPAPCQELYTYRYHSKMPLHLFGKHFTEEVGEQELVDSFYKHCADRSTHNPYEKFDSVTGLMRNGIFITSPLEAYPAQRSARPARAVWSLYDKVRPLAFYDAAGNEDKRFMRRYERKYANDIKDWFKNRDLFALHNPNLYMGFTVSPHLQRLYYGDKGLAVSNYGRIGYPDYFSYKDMAEVGDCDGNWKSYAQYSTKYFTEELNDYTQRVQPALPDSAAFSVMLHPVQQRQGIDYCYDARLLLPADAPEARYVAFLHFRHFVRRLQYDLFAPFYTADGRQFTARFYEGTYSPAHGWAVHDYMRYYLRD
ncbi:MAG: hypothetical protein J6M53_08115 [Bacteroidaceae bacterium]|nr:hypothetical protein [Bacteroidaceae bacterium]